MQEIPFASIDFSDFSSFIFKVNHVFLEEKDNPPEKVVIDEEELDGLEKHCTWNLEDLNVVNNKKNEAIYKPINVHSVKVRYFKKDVEYLESVT